MKLILSMRNSFPHLPGRLDRIVTYKLTMNKYIDRGFFLELELITRFNPGKSFDQAYKDSVEVVIGNNSLKKYRVLSYDDLITSKIKAGRNQDLLDIMMLQKIKNSG